jgi:hypothetical protein
MKPHHLALKVSKVSRVYLETCPRVRYVFNVPRENPAKVSWHQGGEGLMVPAAVFISGIFSAVFQPCDFARPALHFCKTSPFLSFDAINNRGMIPPHGAPNFGI